MIIIGIDPGTAKIGFGIIKKQKGQNPSLVDYGCIRTPSSFSAAKRLNVLYDQLNIILNKYKPDIVTVENIFFFKNLKTAIKVSEARGVILLAANQKKLEIKEFTPLQVKQAVACYGRAEKTQVQKMVKNILKLEEIPAPDDAADALALAICCAHSIDLDGVDR